MNEKRQNIIAEINVERTRQDKEWGGQINDDLNTLRDWATYINYHAVINAYIHRAEKFAFRKSMIRVAALAIAAIESIDRKYSNEDNNG